MTRRWIVWCALGVSTAALAGCGGGPAVESAASDESKRSSGALADLLKESRATLAKKGDDLVAQVRSRDQARRRGSLKLTLVPGWFEPLVLPAVHDAKYQADLGFSVPSYVDPKKPAPDPALAEHYARFGDNEAALKLVGGQAAPALDAHKLEQNFPLEWSRCVAAQLHLAQHRLAAGDRDAMTELICTHQQVMKLLSGKAAKSPLAQDLLARGRVVLAAAAKAWREQGNDLATEAEIGLASWPDERPQLVLSGDKGRWAQQLKATPQGGVLAVAPAARALDFMQLPLGRENAEAAILSFDSSEKLRHVLVTYNSGVRRDWVQPGELAGGLNAWASPTTAGKNGPCTHQWENVKVETALCPVNETFGGWVRVDLKSEAAAPAVARGVAQIHLDSYFETSRLAISPQQQGDHVVVGEEPGLARVENPLPAAKLLKLEFARVEGQDLLREAVYSFQSGLPLHQVALPLFARLGMGAVSNESDAARTYLTLTWEDAVTQVILRLPDDAHVPTTLTLHDRRDASKSAERLGEVAAFEKAERAKRLAAGKPQQRLPRKVEQFPLGMSRSELVKYLPQGRSVVRREEADALYVAVNVPPPSDHTHLVRQIQARFDADQKLSWLRVRYEQAGKPSNWSQQILGAWRTAGGAVSAAPSPYSRHGSGLPPENPAGKFYQWKDDVTEASCLVDRSGVEVTVRNRPPGDEPAPPLAYLPRGAEKVTLDMSLSEVKAVFGHEPETTPDGGFVFRPAKGPFDALVVWPDPGEPSRVSGRVTQIAGRYRTGAAAKTTPADLEKALMTQWATELAVIGWPTRRDYVEKTLQSLIWFDDATRYRIYWAESNNSPPRLWSEWRAEGAQGH
jgi:hypothetical protein